MAAEERAWLMDPAEIGAVKVAMRDAGWDFIRERGLGYVFLRAELGCELLKEVGGAWIINGTRGLHEHFELPRKVRVEIEAAIAKATSLHRLGMPICDECGDSGGAPVHPEQPCSKCGRTCFDD